VEKPAHNPVRDRPHRIS